MKSKTMGINGDDVALLSPKSNQTKLMIHAECITSNRIICQTLVTLYLHNNISRRWRKLRFKDKRLVRAILLNKLHNFAAMHEAIVHNQGLFTANLSGSYHGIKTVHIIDFRPADK